MPVLLKRLAPIPYNSMLPKKKIFQFNVSYGNYEAFVDGILRLAKKRISSYVCVANVHMLIEAADDWGFRRIVNKADIVCPDGMPIAKSFKMLHKQEQVRVDGMSLLPVLLMECEQKGLSVYFYGGRETVLAQTKTYIEINHPELKIVGTHSPPFRKLTLEEDAKTVETINQSGANLVFVVLGCPKQEKWMGKMQGRINSCMIGIGGALPVMIGLNKRAPQWMQKASMEWLYRLGQEPSRLYRRYFYTNTKFLYIYMKAVIAKKISWKKPISF